MNEVTNHAVGNEPQLYSSNIVNTYVKYVQSRYLHVNISELLEFAGMEEYQVEDDGHWFTQSQIDRFYASLVRVTGNHSLAREAGRHTSSANPMGMLTRYLLGFVGPARVFEKIKDLAKRYTRSARYESKRLDRSGYELVVTPYDGVHENEHQCENRIGYFEAIVRLFQTRLPKIEHPECVFRGGTCCRYIVTWNESQAQLWKNIRNVVAVAAAVVVPTLMVFEAVEYWPLVSVSAILALFGVSQVSSVLEKNELKSALTNLRTTTDQLLDDASRHYDHALMVNEIGRIVGKYIHIDTLLPRVVEALQHRLDYDRGLILLANADKTRLEYRAGYGYPEEIVDELRTNGFHLDKPESRGVVVLCYREKRAFLINDAEELSKDLSERSREFLRKIGSKSFLCCPILFEDECLGVLAVDNIQSKRPLVESDMNLLMGIAPEIGISVRNALLTQEREEQFQSVIRTLASSIDARDPLTAGHSQRVTEFALQICRELNLSAEFTEVIRVAAQLHDYGKIAIKDSILKKEGPLTTEERQEIETHAAKSEEILSQIKFLGAYQDVPKIAGAHHERLDGKGYPRGLKGNDIPLGARLIAVADFFEAITAKRHYREPMSFQQAVALLKEESGPHLEPEFVEAFLKVLGVAERAPGS